MILVTPGKSILQLPNENMDFMFCLYFNSDNFIGRMEAISCAKTKTLIVKKIWYENMIKQTKKLRLAIESCINRFAKFNECDKIDFNIAEY